MKFFKTMMAWNEPSDNQKKPDDNSQDKWKPNRPNDGPPDLDEVINKFKAALGFKRSRYSNNGNSSDNSSSPFSATFAIVIVFVIIAMWLASGFYTVDAGKRGVVLFLGSYQKTTDPGLNWRLPYPFTEVNIIDIEQRFSQRIGGDSNNQHESLMLTADEAVVVVRIEVQYQIVNAADYWFQALNPDTTLQQVVESAARERIGQSSWDNILTSERSRIMAEIKTLAQSVLDRYQLGLMITNVNLVDAQPPELVQAAFSDATRAREDEQSRRNQADAYERQIVLEAEGEVAREINKANAYRDQVIAHATGEVSRFNQILTQYELAPAVTHERMYIETIESVLSQTHKVLVDTNSNALMMLPLDQLLNKALTHPKDSAWQSTAEEKIVTLPPSGTVNPTTTDSTSSSVIRTRTRQ